MIYSSSWKDIVFDAGITPFEYQIVNDDKVLHTGYASAYPSGGYARLNVNQTIEEYLNPEFGSDFSVVDDGIVTNPNAYIRFDIINLATNDRVESYGILYDWSYESNWAGEGEHLMTEPINGHLDPRMKALVTMFNSSDPYLVLDTNDGTFDVSGETKFIGVTANTSWGVTSSTSAFTVSNVSDSGFTITCGLNQGTALSGYCTVRTVGGTEAITSGITMSQPANVLYLSDSACTIDSDAQTFIIGVTAGTGYEVSESVPWLSVTGKTNNTFALRATNNSSTSARTAIVTVSLSGTTITKSFTVTQSGYVMPSDEYIIYYTTTDGNTITPNIEVSEYDTFGANIRQNVYSGGTGMIIFNQPVTKFGDRAFSGCTTLNTITVPANVTSLGNYVFRDCAVYRINSYVHSAPSISQTTFYGVVRNPPQGGGLHTKSDAVGYNASWMKSQSYYLTSYNWSWYKDLT